MLWSLNLYLAYFYGWHAFDQKWMLDFDQHSNVRLKPTFFGAVVFWPKRKKAYVGFWSTYFFQVGFWPTMLQGVCILTNKLMVCWILSSFSSKWKGVDELDLFCLINFYPKGLLSVYAGYYLLSSWKSNKTRKSWSKPNCKYFYQNIVSFNFT